MPKNCKSAVSLLTSKLKAAGNKHDAMRQENYMKHVIKSFGVRAPQIKDILKEVGEVKKIDTWTSSDLLAAANDLMKSEYIESKNAAAYMLNTAKNAQKISENASSLESISLMIDNHVNNWSTCDSVGTGIITRMISIDPSYVDKVAQWRYANFKWRKRISCVAFLHAARRGNYFDTILDVCSVCVNDQERFVQLGMGWVLRDVSTGDQKRVIDFIHTHYSSFSREGLRYAIEKMPTEIRLELLNYEKHENKIIRRSQRKRKKLV